MTQEPKQVFVSYTAKDRPAAEAIRDFLEKNGISCWIDVRDIHGGDSYMKEIARAIKECQIVLLILTKQAQESPHILSELGWARKERKWIIPFALENIALKTEFDYHLQNSQCINASADYTTARERLLTDIRYAMTQEKQHPAHTESDGTDSINITNIQSIAAAGEATDQIIVDIEHRTDPIKCPLCKSKEVARKDRHDFRNLMSILCVAVIISCGLMSVVCLVRLVMDICIDNGIQNWILEAYASLGNVDTESDRVLCMSFLVEAVIGYVVFIWNSNATAKEYRKRLVQGKEAIPYRCSKCTQRFTVMLPVEEDT